MLHIDESVVHAANGMVSGKLSEWPVLLAELRRLGYDLDPSTSAVDVKILCRRIIAENN